MSFISNLFGGASSGQEFQAKNPFSSEQQQEAIKHTQNAMQQQNQLVQALQAQGGLQNQSNVFNAMQGTSGALEAAARGEGPNPAQAQLAQATGANTANQAALMAGQRGAGANAGLLARQASMQGAANQQNAAGQAATMGAQQQIAARQQLQQQQQMMGGLASQQAGQLQQGVQSQNQFAQGNQGQMLGAQANANSTNASIAQGNAQRQGGAMSGLIGGIGTALAGPVGGMIGNLFSGGGGTTPAPTASQPSAGNRNTMMPAMAHGGQVQDAFENDGGASRINTGWGKVIMKANGGVIESSGGPQSHHGKYLAMQGGGAVPGQAQVSGDSFKNDTVHALLSPGEVVIPKHIMEAKDAAKRAGAFVAAIIAKNGAK